MKNKLIVAYSFFILLTCNVFATDLGDLLPEGTILTLKNSITLPANNFTFSLRDKLLDGHDYSYHSCFISFKSEKAYHRSFSTGQSISVGRSLRGSGVSFGLPASSGAEAVKLNGVEVDFLICKGTADYIMKSIKRAFDIKIPVQNGEYTTSDEIIPSKL